MTMPPWFHDGVTDPTSLERLKQLYRVYKDKKKSKHLNVKRAVNALFVPRTFTLLHPTTFEVDMLEILVKFCSSAPSKEPGEGAKKKATKQKATRAPSPELGSSISLSDPIAREEEEEDGEEGGQDADPIAREEEEEDGEEGGQDADPIAREEEEEECGQADGDTRGPCEFETYTHICTHTHMLSLDTHTHTLTVMPKKTCAQCSKLCAIACKTCSKCGGKFPKKKKSSIIWSPFAREKRDLNVTWPLRPRLVAGMYNRPKKNTIRVSCIDGMKTVRNYNV